jgi:hypothetical protein
VRKVEFSTAVPNREVPFTTVGEKEIAVTQVGGCRDICDPLCKLAFVSLSNFVCWVGGAEKNIFKTSGE